MYETPKSQLTDDSLISEYEKLVMAQRPIRGSCLAVVATISVLIAFSLKAGLVPGFLFFIPSAVAGFFVKYIGLPIQEKHRIIPSVLVAVIVFLVFAADGIGIIAILMPLISFGLCYVISKRPLNYEQEKSLYKHRLKK